MNEKQYLPNHVCTVLNKKDNLINSQENIPKLILINQFTTGIVKFRVISIFDEAKGYLNSSIRAYVNATSTLDKLFSIKLVVLSMIVAADILAEKIGDLIADAPFHGQFEDSSFFLPMAAYEQRIDDLQFLEENKVIPKKFELSRRLRKALDTLKIAYGEYGFRNLLAIDIKQYINDSQFFIIDIQEIIERKE